jgi:hypothetical protein
VTATFPELHPIGEKSAEAQLLAHPHQGLTAVEVERLHAQQEQVETFQPAAGEPEKFGNG